MTVEKVEQPEALTTENEKTNEGESLIHTIEKSRNAHLYILFCAQLKLIVKSLRTMLRSNVKQPSKMDLQRATPTLTWQRS